MERKPKARPSSATNKVTSIRLDPSLHERARIYSFKAKSTLQAILNEALAEYLKKRGA